VTFISVQAFTPILGTLLLSPNGMVCDPARYAIVDFLSRIRKADEREEQERNLGEGQGLEETEDEDDYPTGLFGTRERKIFRDEILQQVVIGMGRLDASEEAEVDEDMVQGGWDGGNAEVEPPQQALDTKAEIVNVIEPRREDVVNPYFPALSDWPAPSPASEAHVAASTWSAPNSIPNPLTSATGANANVNARSVMHVSFAQLPLAPSVVASYQPDDQAALSPDWVPSNFHQAAPDPPIAEQEQETKVLNEYHGDSTHAMDYETEIESGVDEQAAVGRLASMSLMAAVAASGMSCFNCQSLTGC
jgi:serine/threonine-protein phosphatase 4 regulatory subunit 1